MVTVSSIGRLRMQASPLRLFLLTLMLESITLSDVLGYASIGCWLGAQFPQVIENIKLQSCEGLALPFLANWLLGDISNLVGCILTHQLPFQTWLATYFVFVDFMLVSQYFYYYKPRKGPPSALGHIRTATSPSRIRRMSLDRGASKYRALSAVASNMAAAAALAAQQEDHRPSITRQSTRASRRQLRGESSQSSAREDEDEYEENFPSAMVDSFHSEGGRDKTSKRVSWSVERHRGRAASVGQSIRLPNHSSALPDEFTIPTTSPNALYHEPSSHQDTNLLANSVDSLASPVVPTRSSRASRKGSTMVFLGIWALFGIGTLTGQRSMMTGTKTTNIGRVLSSGANAVADHTPVAFGVSSGLYMRDVDTNDIEQLDLDLPFLPSDMDHGHLDTPDDHEEPSSEQVLGRIFAWLCTTLYLTSRLPQIWKNYVRKSVEGLSMYLFVFAFLGNSFYVSSILTSPRRFLPPPEASNFLRESIPYLLGSGGTLIFDITIVAQSFCYKPRHKRHTSIHNRMLDEEEAGLLSGDAHSTHPESAITNRGRASRTHSIS